MKYFKALVCIIMVAVVLLLTSCTEQDPGYTVIVSSDGDELLIDHHTESVVTLPYEYHQLYEGNLYTTSQNNDLANGAFRETLIITPDSTIDVHFVIKIETEVEASYTLYEEATTSDDGTPEIIINKNRQSTNISAIVITYDPTITLDGTLLITEHWGTGKSRGGEERSEAEWILNHNTKYLLRVQNETTSDNYVSTVLLWYEH